MQISSINTQSFKCDYCNPERIEQLEAKRIANQWGSEGCTGGLNETDARELELRREYMALMNKAEAIKWGSEGCNASLPDADSNRVAQIQAELREIAESKAKPQGGYGAYVEAVLPNDRIDGTYDVPMSTFWGDWAR